MLYEQLNRRQRARVPAKRDWLRSTTPHYTRPPLTRPAQRIEFEAPRLTSHYPPAANRPAQRIELGSKFSETQINVQYNLHFCFGSKWTLKQIEHVIRNGICYVVSVHSPRLIIYQWFSRLQQSRKMYATVHIGRVNLCNGTARVAEHLSSDNLSTEAWLQNFC